MNLNENFSAYGNWRSDVIEAVTRLRGWFSRNELGDAQGDLRLRNLVNRLSEDKLVVAFVAEFSRGKSELINAMFFSGYGNRILPSSAGRTTMCPTELLWSPGDLPELCLLPIETRSAGGSVIDLKKKRDMWHTEPLDTTSPAGLQAALGRVCEVRRVSVAQANEYGFLIDQTEREGMKPDADGMVEIPAWRHAIIRFPHPLLEQGLVILDTPGLNAVGAEPELTLSLLPNAHAVLFVLAVDTGVTQSDLAIWRDYVQTGSATQRGRLVALNKIDSLWDGLRAEDRIEEEISQQVQAVSEMLQLPTDQIFPISAQKALVGRIQKDEEQVKRSRLPLLEAALTQDLLPTKQDIVREDTLNEIHDLTRQVNVLLVSRRDNVEEQIRELVDLRGKNQAVIEYMMRKVRSEKEEFEQGLQKYYAVRSVFTNKTNTLLANLGMDNLRGETLRTRDAMNDSTFASGAREAVKGYFNSLRKSLQQSSKEIEDIAAMMGVMYKRFTVEHGLKLETPGNFSTAPYAKEIDRLERAFNNQFGGSLMLVTKNALAKQFFESIAVHARRTFETANRDIEQWLRTVMSPLETQVREYQLQLKRRLESIRTIHQATGTLEERIVELQQAESTVVKQLEELRGLETKIRQAVERPISSVSLAA